MKHLKLIGKITVIVGALSLWTFFSARSDYQWADCIIEQETSKGWIIITQQNNFIDIASPWTLIKTPVTGLWFVNNSSTKQLNQEIYLIYTQHVSYNYSKTDRKKYWELVNIKAKELAIIGPQHDLSNLNINTLKWYKYKPGMPGHQIIEFMVDYDKNN